MRRLIYASRWTGAVRADSGLALQQIVAKSIQNNRVSGLTGFLLAFDGVFLQVLEGPDAEIAETYARIGGDSRHDEITLIADTPAEARSFRDWNMCGVSLDSADARLVRSGVAGGDAFDGAAALDLLKAVAAAEAERERQAAV